ncbi:MAG: hypothetical protein DMG96_36360 [Acidobacteria bacterium]|nr:MAG: hypothetical protein DMG96_36360 [Acidobacteriota bacterium]
MQYLLPVTIEDRNGNIVRFSGNSNGSFTQTDSLGRTAVSASGFLQTGSTVTVSGLSNPYVITWGTTNINFTSANYNVIPQQTGCTFQASDTTSGSGISSITLPNNKQFTFTYDATFGQLSKITYPSGGYVQYTWGFNQYSGLATFPADNGSSGPPYSPCEFVYSKPAVIERYVSFDGTTLALHQHFDYSTTWNPSAPDTWTSMQTIVTTTDLLRNVSFTTTYTYSPIPGPNVPDFPYEPDNQIPVETTILTKDNSGTTIRTVNESWVDQFEIASEQTVLENGLTSATSYTYGPGAQVTEKDEYDFGSSPHGPLLRKTVTRYQSFGAISIFDRPCQVIVYDGSGTNRIAETDSLYDAGTSVCGAVGTPSVASVSNLVLGTHDESNYGPTSTTPRGNATTVTRQCFPNCTNAVTTFTHDETGQVLSMTDPCGNATCSDMNVSGETHTTTYSYADSYTTLSNGQNVSYTPSANTNAYLTRITYPTTVTADFNGTHAVQHVENFTYDFNNGQLTVSKDQNNQTSAYLYNDSLARPTLINYPDGGQTTISYNDSAPSPSVTASKKIDTSGRLLTTVTAMDGLGHIVKTQLCEDGSACTQPITADTIFNGLSRVWKQSNPHRIASLSTDGTTTYFYDALGRSCLVVPPDGTLPTGNACPATSPANDVFTTYSGNCATVTDQAGKGRKSCSDGLGRLNQVTEDPGGVGYVTNYFYDALDNLLSLVQNGSHQRYFTYNSLSQLTSASNPESGAIFYSYDANGNLTTKAAFAPNQTGTVYLYTSYGYDALNRKIWKVYSDSEPNVQFSYDQSSVLNGVAVSNPIGRLTAKNTNTSGTYPTSSVYFAYDQMGRVLSYFQCVLNCATSGWEMFYTYDLLGNVTSYTNGLGTTFTQHFDNAGRLYQITSSLSDPAHPSPLATVDSSVGFWPNGALRKVALGNGLYETAAYNSRSQPCRVNVNSTATYTLTQCNDSLPGGNVQDFNYGFNFGSSNNGNVASWSATGNQNFNRSYTHDALNRLATLSATSDPTGCNGLSWTYDAWGNRTDQTVTAGSCNTFHATVNTANQLLDPVNNKYQYDAAGNMTHDASHTYFYDAENRLAQVDGTYGNCSTATACYLYDADGKRVQKVTGATQTIYLYDLSGKVINELDGNNVALANYIYFNGSLLAEYKGATTYFVHKDHLGSTRLVTGLTNPASPVDNLDYLPFGEQVAGGSATTHKFTAKERDSDSWLDNFGSRYMSNSMGRFMSPDWARGISPIPYADISDPQTLSLYAYVGNNPLGRRDLDGHHEVCDPDTSFMDNSGALHVLAGKCHEVPDWWQFQGVRNWFRKGGSWIGKTGTSFAAILSRSLGSWGGPRGGKPFTRNGRQLVINDNAAEHGGQTTCENCGRPTVPGQQSQSGVTPPDNETAVDHIWPQSELGNGEPNNGQVLCRVCNGLKSNSLPQTATGEQGWLGDDKNAEFIIQGLYGRPRRDE